MNDEERVKKWMNYAERDLDAAASLIESGHYDHSIFWSQQAAEKAVKALYIKTRGGLVPKTHNVGKLVRSFDAPDDVIRYSVYLTEEYLITRYPEAVLALPPIVYTREIAEDRLSGARIVVAWAKDSIEHESSKQDK